MNNKAIKINLKNNVLHDDNWMETLCEKCNANISVNITDENAVLICENESCKHIYNVYKIEFKVYNPIYSVSNGMLFHDNIPQLTECCNNIVTAHYLKEEDVYLLVCYECGEDFVLSEDNIFNKTKCCNSNFILQDNNYICNTCKKILIY